MKPTADELRKLLHYDPETGVFTRLVRTTNSVQVGDIAGCVDARGEYRKISIGYGRYYEHQLAWLYMTGEWPTGPLDHRDLDGLNNRWPNLRPATKSQNAANMRARKDNRHGFKGVTPTPGGWRAGIWFHGTRHHIGLFATAEEASAAYAAKAAELFGEFARA